MADETEVDLAEGIKPDDWAGERIMIDLRAQAWLDERKAEFFKRGGTITVLPAMTTPFINYATARGAKHDHE